MARPQWEVPGADMARSGRTQRDQRWACGGGPVNGARKAIDSPLWIDFSTAGAPPMAYLLPEGEHLPMGRVERPAPDVVIGHTTWYTEIAAKLEGRVVVLYQMDFTPEDTYLVACLEDYPEGWFKLVTGDDFGDRLTELLRIHWPDIYEMLRLSTASVLGHRVLCNLHTVGKTQWVVAEPMAPTAAGMIDEAQVREFVVSSLEVVLRTGTTDFFMLPGVVEAMGGPDKLSRRLTALSNLIGGATGMAGGFIGGVKADELIPLGRDARDFIGGLRRFRDG